MIILYEKATGKVLQVTDGGIVIPCKEHGVLEVDDYREEKVVAQEWLDAASAKEKDIQAVEIEKELYENHIVELTKTVIELKQKVEALTGEKCATDTAPLEAKLAECDALKAEISKTQIAGPQIELPPG